MIVDERFGANSSTNVGPPPAVVAEKSMLFELGVGGGTGATGGVGGVSVNPVTTGTGTAGGLNVIPPAACLTSAP